MDGVALSTHGVPIRYETHGMGDPALVLVHGWSCDRGYWRGQVDHFAARRQVVTIDLAGHGESGVSRETWTMPAFGEDVVAVVDELGLDRVVLVGHSMGGDVIVETAIRIPGRLVGLVWVDVYRTLDGSGSREEVEEFVAPFRDDFTGKVHAFVRTMFPPDADPGLVDWVASDMGAAPPAIAIPALEHALGNAGPILTHLPRLPAPLVAINAGYRETDVEALARYGIRIVVMPDVGHFPMLEDPAGFNRQLDDAIASFIA